MSETVQIWLLGGLAGWCVILSVGVLRLIIAMTKLETLLSLKSRTASKILHSPDDHLQIDALLEKHHQGIITKAEWETLSDACEKIADDPGRSTIERWLAATVLSDPKNGFKV